MLPLPSPPHQLGHVKKNSRFHQMIWKSTGILRGNLRLHRVFFRFSTYREHSHNINSDMKLYTDKGNPNLLRIFAAKNLSGVVLDVLYVNQEGTKISSFNGIYFKIKHYIYFFIHRISLAIVLGSVLTGKGIR